MAANRFEASKKKKMKKFKENFNDKFWIAIENP